MAKAAAGEIHIEYEVRGRRGTPLLLVGGLGAQLISWDEDFCDALVDHGYLVVRYDNRDAGLSTSLDSLGVPDLLGLLLGGSAAPYQLEAMAQDALCVLDHLGLPRAHVLGLSLGGMIGQLLALRHPGRVTTLVAALSGPAGRPDRLPAPAVVDALLQPSGPTLESRVDAAVELRRSLANDGLGFDEQGARARAVAQITRSYRPAGTMRQAAAVLATPNRLGELSGLAVPSMVVHGDRDPLVPFESALAAARAIPGSVFVPLPGVGHDLPHSTSGALLEHVRAFHAQAQPAP